MLIYTLLYILEILIFRAARQMFNWNLLLYRKRTQKDKKDREQKESEWQFASLDLLSNINYSGTFRAHCFGNIPLILIPV